MPRSRTGTPPKRVLARFAREQHPDRKVLEPFCGQANHRESGLDWCRVPRPGCDYERVAVCGICHPNPFLGDL